MARGTQEFTGGRFTHYGPRGVDQKFGDAQSRVGNDTIVEYVFDGNDLPTPSELNEMVATIPAGSIILEAVVFALEDAAGTGPLTVGVADPDGTNVVALLSETVANLEAGDAAVGAGAGIGKAIASDKQVVVAGVTGGKFKAQVKYRAPEADAAGVKTY